jgi:hypothetical protein
MGIKKQILNLRNYLFIIILILNISFVFGIDYKIYSDGALVHSDNIPNIDNLQWKILFMTYGGNKGASFPTLSVSGDALYSVSATNDEFPAVGHGSGWDLESTRWAGSDAYRNFEHFVSYENKITKRQVIPGTYDFKMEAYGDGIHPSVVEPDSWFLFWNNKGCTSPVTDEEGYNEFFEFQNSDCNPFLAANKCPSCGVPNDCEEYGIVTGTGALRAGYFCNGVWAKIMFFEGSVNVFNLTSDNWADGNLNRTYDKEDKGLMRTWLTDITPGNVNVSQEIRILSGECNVGDDCILGKYCRASDSTCQSLDDCQKANSGGYGQIPDLDLDDDPCTDDGIFCTNDVCDNGFCVNNPLDDDTPCPDNDDGIFCTDEVCFSGACINDPVDLNCEIWEDCDGLVPVNDGCVQNNCSSCENCVDWYGDQCGYTNCHDSCDVSEPCYFDPDTPWVCRSEDDACEEIDSCDDYSVSECSSDPCLVDTAYDLGCEGFKDISCIDVDDPDPYNLGCRLIDNIGQCNNFSLHDGNEPFYCAWDAFEPPAPAPTCLACGETVNACFAYDNEETCNADPCYNAAGSCVLFGCNTDEDWSCYWEDAKCKFNGTIGLDTSCSYSAEILASCLNADRMLVDFTGVPPAECLPKKVNYPCGQLISLDFFNWKNIFASLFILFGFYYIVNRRLK